MHRLAGLLVLAASCCTAAPFSVRLLASASSPQPVGVKIGLQPVVDSAPRGMAVYRYSVSVNGGPFRIIRDYSQEPAFVWSPELYEQGATVRVSVRINDTKDVAACDLPYRIDSRLKGSVRQISPTAHPLIALFSAPACPDGSKFQVAYRREGDETISRTPGQPCRPSLTNNVYVAGMRADTEYRMRSEVAAGKDVRTGAWLPFHTGMLDGDFPPVTVAVPRVPGSTASEPVMVHSPASLSAGKRPFATDLDGNVIWYLPSTDFLTRMSGAGHMLVLADGMNSVNSIRRQQIVREYDIAGRVIRETNIGRVAEQLDGFGIHSDCRKGGSECVSGFHHEAVRLPNGHVLVIAGLERMMPAGTQGSKEPVDVLGDIVVDLNEQLQVAAVWNCFDHLDIKRASLYNATCNLGPGADGCPAIFLADKANGWTHGNSLNYIPATGDFLISMPEQDWVLKVDWRNGTGTGKILWRLGKDGDFTAKTDDPYPWFSFQHDAGFDPVGSNVLSILDDGHQRFEKNPKALTRGQVWKLDEETRTATLVQNPDLGVYAIAVGSAQRLKNGGNTFEAGFINPASVYARAVETDAAGKIVYALQVDGMIVYRSFRLDDIYSAAPK
ncbi:MAG: aryl-sulfate sulfotransferase [Bryobacteraceae bacterium]